jgi:starvation-inducible DNA-binding protein
MASLLHETRMSLPEKERIESIAFLNKTLASLADLYAQTKQAHWNIKGLEFIELHLLFDKIAEEVENHADIVAERITSLGGTTLATTQEIGKNTQLRLYPVDIFSAKDHLEHLTHNYAILGELARKNIKATEELGDYATSDVYIALTRMLDHNLWFMEAHIQK